MPVQRKHIDALGLFRANASSHPKKQHGGKHQETHDDVKSVEAHERVVCGAKKIGRDGQAVLINQAVPFLARTEEKESAKNNGEQPETKERAAFAAFERSGCE